MSHDAYADAGVGEPEASELGRVLKKERLLRAIYKSGAETTAAILAAETLETDSSVCAELVGMRDKIIVLLRGISSFMSSLR